MGNIIRKKCDFKAVIEFESANGGGIDVDCEIQCDDAEFASTTLTPADLAALGYAPKPVWRDAVNDPPTKEGRYPVMMGELRGDVEEHYLTLCAWQDGEWMTPDYCGVLLWYPLPALPGKGE